MRDVALQDTDFGKCAGWFSAASSGEGRSVGASCRPAPGRFWANRTKEESGE